MFPYHEGGEERWFTAGGSQSIENHIASCAPSLEGTFDPGGGVSSLPPAPTVPPQRGQPANKPPDFRAGPAPTSHPAVFRIRFTSIIMLTGNLNTHCGVFICLRFSFSFSDDDVRLLSLIRAEGGGPEDPLVK